MPPSTSVLVPLAVLQGETLSESTAELLSSVDVVLLGYHELPEQTATEQARDQYENRLRRRLEEYSSLFDDSVSLRTRIVFTHNPQQTTERIAIEERISSILLPNPAPTIQQILVAIRGSVNLDQLTSTTADIVAETDCEVCLFHAARTESSYEAGDQLLATATKQLVAAGVDPVRISTELTVTRSPLRAISTAAEAAEFVIIGEKAPSLADRIFGDVADRLATSTAGPVLVVRKLRSPAEK